MGVSPLVCPKASDIRTIFTCNFNLSTILFLRCNPRLPTVVLAVFGRVLPGGPNWTQNNLVLLLLR